jgi:hypothetical protein
MPRPAAGDVGRSRPSLLVRRESRRGACCEPKSRAWGPDVPFGIAWPFNGGASADKGPVGLQERPVDMFALLG